MKPKPKKAFKSGAPRKGYKWAEPTDNKLPNPPIVPVKKDYKPKPMRLVSSGTTGGGKPTKTVKNKARSL
jgi:hypothetical protein